MFGCIHYNEEIWLQKDGSGEINIEVITNVLILDDISNDILASINGNKKFTVKSQALSLKGDSSSFNVRFSFDKLTDLNSLRFPGGIYTYQKDQDGNPYFNREFLPYPQSDSAKFDSNTNNEFAVNCKFLVHLPYAVKTTNGIIESKDKKTIRWNVNINSPKNKPAALFAQMKNPLRFMILIMVVIVVIILILTWFFFIKKTPRKKHKIQVETKE